MPLASALTVSGGRQTVPYARARQVAETVGQALLDLGAGPERPVLLLSGNSVDHLLLTLGCYTAGVPAVPASVAYSLMSTDHHQIRAMAELVSPGVVFADDATQFGSALDAVVGASPTSPVVVVSAGTRTGAHRLADLAATEPGPTLAGAFDAIAPDAVAKILFTSGSTGTPKGVITTHAC